MFNVWRTHPMQQLPMGDGESFRAPGSSGGGAVNEPKLELDPENPPAMPPAAGTQAGDSGSAPAEVIAG